MPNHNRRSLVATTTDGSTASQPIGDPVSEDTAREWLAEWFRKMPVEPTITIEEGA